MEPASSSSASSLVSKAKTAFHSAAARAEKVLTDIKTDLKHDREGEGDSHKAPKKLSEHECNVADKSRGDECYNEFKHSRWKPPHLGIKQEWQHRLKNIKRGRKGVEDKERPESLTPDILALDEYLNHMDPGLEQGSIGVEDASIASNVVSVPPTSVIKQLGVALEAGKKFKSLKDLLASTRGSSPIKERSGLSFSAVKSLVLREKDEKLLPEPDDNEEVLSLIHSLFDACREEHIPKMENGSCSKIPTTVYLPRDIHGAPPESFVVRLSEIIGSLKSPQRMASFWFNVVAELRRLWSEGQPVPRMPLDEIPDLNYCLLHQQLQVINCCIARERRRIIAVESLDSVMKETNTSTEGSGVSVSNQSSNQIIYARTGTGDVVLRLGADHPSRGLTMLETDEPVYSPVTQEGPILTEDLIRETEEFVLRTGSVGAGCSQLLSDMQAFKAANPGCILEDFVRWHSPPDWTEAKSDDDTKDSFDGGEPSSRKGQLSSRMQKEGNLWRELWETARPLPAVKQTPLFDEDLAVEGILNVLEDISPSELFEQLFVSVLSSSFTIAEAALPSNSDLSKLFYDCKDYLIAICQGDLCSDNIDDLCQVYETVETILLNPEGPSVTKPSEETITNEPRRRFMRISLNFTGNDKQIPCKPAPKDQKKSAEQQTHVFSQFFDGKSSLFGKKTPKPNMSEAGAPSCLDDSDWTIID